MKIILASLIDSTVYNSLSENKKHSIYVKEKKDRHYSYMLLRATDKKEADGAGRALKCPRTRREEEKKS